MGKFGRWTLPELQDRMKLSLSEEFAAERARVALEHPTDAELIDTARWMVDHPDTSGNVKMILAALLREIDRRA